MTSILTVDLTALADQIKIWGRELGFQQIAITDIDLQQAEQRLKEWLNKGYQGDMNWMEEHGDKRYRPEKLHPGTLRVISARMNYLPANSNMISTLKQPDTAYISRYALGRDYHKLIRKRLAQLAQKISDAVPGSIEQRPFVDSAPVMEKALAEKAGLGWVGKNTLVLNSEAGSWFFLGEIFTSLPLPTDQSTEQDRCGKCKACMTVCPTNAFPKPYVLDARRCISYLTIELKGSIPEEFREPMGNRVFGCDDCQAMCPWNRFAKASQELDFLPRHKLDSTRLVDLFNWTETEFLERTAGSPIRRIGYQRWLRNLAVGLGNAPYSDDIISTLEARREKVSEMVWEHIEWALEKQRSAHSVLKKTSR
ncbi:tRNA epoxyqueuosine(34) reductase QueG [bacterium SCSIO 12696]|nr:tRNA epoxyqueuosine(34) reductase QueG [bacterium SCSIO 12696]